GGDADGGDADGGDVDGGDVDGGDSDDPTSPAFLTTGLTLHFDATRAVDDSTPASDCTDDTTWFDLYGTLGGALVGFPATCTTSSGWQGDGTPADPHRLVFDGSTYVNSNFEPVFQPGDSFAIGVIFRTNFVPTSDRAI